MGASPSPPEKAEALLAAGPRHRETSGFLGHYLQDSVYHSQAEVRTAIAAPKPKLGRSNGEEAPLAGHALELMSATVVEFES